MPGAFTGHNPHFDIQAQVKRGIYPNHCSSLSVGIQRHLLMQPGQFEHDSMGYSRTISEKEATQAEISSKSFFFQKHSLQKLPPSPVPRRQSGFCVPGMTTSWCAGRGQEHGWVEHVRHCSEIASQNHALLWGIENSVLKCCLTGFEPNFINTGQIFLRACWEEHT